MRLSQNQTTSLHDNIRWFFRPRLQRHCVLACTVLASFSLLATPKIQAQVGRPAASDRTAFTDPAEFFERFLGNDSEADRDALQKIEISRREEARAGAAALEGFLAHLKQRRTPAEKTGKDVKYVERLVSELRPLMTNFRRYPKIDVWMADTDETDARSFPGGTIVITRGLVDFCESEAALVGILGHELSHIDRGHQLYHLRRWKLAQKSFTSGADVNRMLSASSMMARTFMRPFRPEEESEADEDGARWAFRLGYAPSELARVFLSMHQRNNQPNFMPAFLRSHPFHMDRYQAILKVSEALEREHPEMKLYIGRTNVRNRITRAQRMFAD